MEFDNPEAYVIRNLPEVRNFMGIPFTIYYKNGKVVKATSSIQSRQQVTSILDKEFGVPVMLQNDADARSDSRPSNPDTDLADDWRELTHPLYSEGYRAGTIAHFGWRENGAIVATAGVMIRDDFPANTLKPRRYGWIMDVYVLPGYRRHGHARRLTQETLAWLRGKGVVFARLVASEQAKQARLYEKLGFTFANEMRLHLAAPAG